MKKPLPTVSQIREVKRLFATDLFDVPTIARLTGIPLREVFRITKSMLPAILVGPDGTILDGTHRLAAK